MKTVGIIAEFNPFHNGHKYLIEQAKLQTGADCCVIIMSGDFVQRGAPAISNKYLRTEMALKGGADIVFELPTVFSLGSAEMFAEGAVSLFSATGCIDHLCFGSESGDTDALAKCASIIEDYTSTSEFKDELTTHIKNGESYPSAFSNTLSNALGSLQSLLVSPNNLLGIEYIKALSRYRNTITSVPDQNTAPDTRFRIPIPLAIKRFGSDHFDSALTDFSSATAIRDYIIDISSSKKTQSKTVRDDLGLLADSLPGDSYKIITENFGRLLPVTEDDFSNMLYMCLNTMPDEELFSIPDINPDLIHKLMDFKGKKISFPELILGLKSKCFTYTAISRALFRILLSPAYAKALEFLAIQSSLLDEPGKTPLNKAYLRLLGFNKNSSEFLRQLRYSEQLDIITKPADGPLSNPSYRLDIFASSLYEQVCSNKFNSPFTEELKAGPVII